MLGADQAYDGMYGQGPPSIHSSHGGRIYQPEGKSLQNFFHFHSQTSLTYCFIINLFSKVSSFIMLQKILRLFKKKSVYSHA